MKHIIKSTTLGIRVTEEQKKKIQEEADKKRMSLTEYIIDKTIEKK